MASLPFLVIPRSVATAVIGFALGVGVGYGLFLVVVGNPAPPAGPRPRPPWEQSSLGGPGAREFPGTARGASIDARPVGMHPLAVGAKVPPLPAQWLNGPPPPVPPGKGQVLVVDVWSES
jgi:hypothetical protein